MGVPCKFRLSPLLRWETPAGHRPAPGSHAARCGAGPTFDPGHLATSGDIPDVTTGGEHNWPLAGRGQRCRYVSCGQGHPVPGASAESPALQGHTARQVAEVTVLES